MNAIMEVSVLLSCRQRLSGTGLAKLNSQQENVITDSVPGEDVSIIQDYPQAWKRKPPPLHYVFVPGLVLNNQYHVLFHFLTSSALLNDSVTFRFCVP